jgi:hypothetical protein
MKSAARREQHHQHTAYLGEEARPAILDDTNRRRAFAPQAEAARSVRSDQKWSSRQTLLFIIGVSAFLWAALIWVSLRYL